MSDAISSPGTARLKSREVEYMIFDGTSESADAIVEWAKRNGGGVTRTMVTGSWNDKTPSLALQMTEDGEVATPGDRVVRAGHGSFQAFAEPDFVEAFDEVVKPTPNVPLEGEIVQP